MPESQEQFQVFCPARWRSYLKEGHIFDKSEHDEHDQLCLRVVRAERLQLCKRSGKVTNVFVCSFGQTDLRKRKASTLKTKLRYQRVARVVLTQWRAF